MAQLLVVRLFSSCRGFTENKTLIVVVVTVAVGRYCARTQFCTEMSFQSNKIVIFSTDSRGSHCCVPVTGACSSLPVSGEVTGYFTTDRHPSIPQRQHFQAPKNRWKRDEEKELWGEKKALPTQDAAPFPQQHQDRLRRIAGVQNTM